MASMEVCVTAGQKDYAARDEPDRGAEGGSIADEPLA